jgi:hypothetical protein
MYRDVRIQDCAATDKDVGRYDCMDAGGRATPGAVAESNAGAVAGMRA